MIKICVPGVARPQGSKRPIRLKTGKIILLENNHAELKAWRVMIATLAAEQMTGKQMFEGPLSIDVLFIFTRPKLHYNSKGLLKDSAPMWKTSKPDVDKLIRAVGDSLTGIVYRDDSQIVHGTFAKRFSDKAETQITVTEIGDGFDS